LQPHVNGQRSIRKESLPNPKSSGKQFFAGQNK